MSPKLVPKWSQNGPKMYGVPQEAGIQKNLPFVILKNSYNDRSLRNKHLLNLSHGEQAWINDKPFFFHYGRGSGRSEDLYNTWLTEVSKYLGLKS